MTYRRKQGNAVDPFARYSWSAPDHGLLAANFDPIFGVGTTVQPTAGRLEFAKIRIPASISVTNILMMCLGGGGSLTTGQCFAVLYAPDLTRVGVTADQATAWGTSGLKTMALASGPFTCPAGNYFVAFWFNGTTGPTWARTGAISVNMPNIGVSSPNLFVGSADTGLTTTSPSTMGAQTAQSSVWWVGLS